MSNINVNAYCETHGVSKQTSMDLQQAIGGTYELTDGRSFWVDAVTVREIMSRIVPVIGAAVETAVRVAHQSPPSKDNGVGLPIELNGISDALENGKGMWCTCSGCHESNEGHPTGPYSSIMRCHLGGGCFECGGIGAIWDTTDYEEMGNALAEQAIAEAKQPDHRHDFVPNKKYSWFCAHCGYAPHEPLKHFQPATTGGRDDE